MADTIYRGSETKPTGREGECWTDSLDDARAYCDTVWAAEVDLGATVAVEGYDHEANETPADDDDFRARHAADGATWITYDDEDEGGFAMTCYRLVRAIDLTATLVADDDDE